MFKRGYYFLLIAVIVNVIFPTGDIFALNLDTYFPHNVGDKWIYEFVRNNTEEAYSASEVVSNEQDRIIFSKDPQGEDHYIITKDGLMLSVSFIDMENSEYVDFLPPLVIIPANLESRQQIILSGAFEHHNKGTVADRGNYIAKIEVSSSGTVVTPAGNFENCIKITSSTILTMDNKDVRTFEGVQWYAAKIGMIKRHYKDSYISKDLQEEIESDKEEMILKEAIVANKHIRREGAK